MIAKKNSKADLERKRFAFFQIGLIVAGSLCLAAFEYSTARVSEQKMAELPPESGILPPEEVPDYEPVPKEQKAAVFTDNVDTFNIVKKLPKEAIFVQSKGEEIIVVEEGGEGIYFFEGIIEEDDTVLDFAPVDPQFPGGPVAMMNWIQSQITYPSMAAEMGIQGTVHLSFVVNKDGSIEQIKTLQGVHEDLDNEAIRVMRMMPKWSPGENAGGKPVRVRYNIPFQFALR
ncbi:MAG: energy transducer TonB [Flavobacteriales bacterium]|jgi:protein TonB|nr:energy transducer TonB [Flavobacteriales bacterium]